MPRSLADVTRSIVDIAGGRDFGRSSSRIIENEFFSFGFLANFMTILLVLAHASMLLNSVSKSVSESAGTKRMESSANLINSLVPERVFKSNNQTVLQAPALTTPADACV